MADEVLVSKRTDGKLDVRMTPEQWQELAVSIRRANDAEAERDRLASQLHNRTFPAVSQEEIDELRAERDRLQKTNERLIDMSERLGAVIPAGDPVEQVEALRRDAERFRKLEDNHNWTAKIERRERADLSCYFRSLYAIKGVGVLDSLAALADALPEPPE